MLDAKQLKKERASAADLREMGAAQVAKRKASTSILTTSERKQQSALKKAKEAMREDAKANAKPAAKPKASKIAHHAKALPDAGAISQQQFEAIVKGAGEEK